MLRMHSAARQHRRRPDYAHGRRVPAPTRRRQVAGEDWAAGSVSSLCWAYPKAAPACRRVSLQARAPRLNPAAIVAALKRHQVRYVIIGAFAAIAQQAPIPATRGIDLTSETGPENLARLSLALQDL